MNLYGHPMIPASVVGLPRAGEMLLKQNLTPELLAALTALPDYPTAASDIIAVWSQMDYSVQDGVPYRALNFLRMEGDGVARNVTLTVMEPAVAPPPVPPHTHPVYFSVGTATIPTLLLSATADVTVTLAVAMPSASYGARTFVSGAVNLISALSVTATTILSATQVRCTVKNTGLVTLSGGELVVLGISPAGVNT